MSATQPLLHPPLFEAIRERDAAIAQSGRDLPGVTVCVTYHNEPWELLWRALDSIVAQTVKPQEVIIIDDGSETAPVGISRDGHGFPMRVYSITNRGLPAARNTGIMLAHTEGIVFLDSDDWLEDAYIEKTLPWLEEGADVVLTGLQEHGPVRRGTYMPGYDRHHTEVTWELIVRDYNRFFYCSLLRTSMLREVGGYNPLMAGPWGRQGGMEDADLWVDLLRRGYRFEGVYEPLFNYSTESTQSMAQTMDRTALQAEIRRHHRCE